MIIFQVSKTIRARYLHKLLHPQCVRTLVRVAGTCTLSRQHKGPHFEAVLINTASVAVFLSKTVSYKHAWEWEGQAISAGDVGRARQATCPRR